MASKFKRPTTDKILSAIGLKKVKDTSDEAAQYEVLHDNVYPKNTIPQSLTRAIIPDPAFFNNIPKPKRHDWLSENRELGQSFLNFTRCVRSYPDAKRKNIYIMPASFDGRAVPKDVIAALLEYSALFFGMDVKLMKAKAALKKSVPSRINEGTGKFQVHAGAVLEQMQKLMPADAFCVGVLTLCDLFPNDDQDHVMGHASLHNGVGVYSLARLLPGVPDNELDLSELSSEERSQLLVSACKLMCHEVCHMFGLQHCIYFHCLMNGANHYDEAHAQPYYLCPVCLRKLQLACGFDVLTRYRRLQHWCLEKGLESQEEWFRRRVEAIGS